MVESFGDSGFRIFVLGAWGFYLRAPYPERRDNMKRGPSSILHKALVRLRRGQVLHVPTSLKDCVRPEARFLVRYEDASKQPSGLVCVSCLAALHCNAQRISTLSRSQ